MVEILLLWDRLHMVVVVVRCGTESQQADQELQLAVAPPYQAVPDQLAYLLFLRRKVFQVVLLFKIGHTVIKLEAVEVLAAPGVMAQHLEILEHQEMVAPVKHQQLLELYTVAVAAADVTEMETRELVLMALE
jgi:hypothetical protein